MITAESVETALCGLLPAAPAVHVARLAKLIAEASAGALTSIEVQARIAAEPALGSLLQALAGRMIEAGTAAISFGLGNSIGTITIGKVAGRDIVEINIILQQLAPGVP